MKITNLIVMLVMLMQSVVPMSARPARPAGMVAETPSATPTESPTPIPTEAPIAPTVTPSPTEPPIVPEVPEITLSLKAEPQIIIPGETVTILWQIEGVETLKEDAFLRFYAPEGFTISGMEAAKPGEGLDLPINSAEGKSEWEAATSVKLPVVLAAEFWQGGEALAKAEVELQAKDESLVDAGGGEVVGLGGRVRVKFPEGAAADTLQVKINKPSKEALPVASLSGSPFEVTAFSESRGELVSTFSQAITIEVSYVEGLGNGSEEDIRAYWFDPETKEWKLPLGQSVNPETNTVTITTDHFTVFDTYNSNWQTAETPTMSFFQTSGFTGAASFSMPIKVPAGPGGFKPDVSISYSSSTVDSVSSESQASWAGMGWNVTGGGYIERFGRGSNSLDDDSFQLNTSGMSGEIILGADGYHLGDENFARITYNETAETWKIISKDGTQFFFNQQVEYPVGDGTQEIWRWMLTEVRNRFDQEIVYTYAIETKPGGMITWAYPEEIRYSNNRYRVLFVRNQDRADYKLIWTGVAYVAYQQSLLDNIRVEQDSDGNGTFETLIRTYQFTYASTAGASIFTSLVWDMGGRTPTLTKVQEFGLGGTDSLPAYTFTYGDDMHLTQATNGYGGTIVFEYELWHDTEGGNPKKYEFNENPEGWGGTNLEYGSGGNIKFWGTVQNTQLNSFQPGRYYKAVASVRGQTNPPPTFQLGFDYKVGGVTYSNLSNPVTLNYGGAFTQVTSEAFLLPVNATKIIPKMVSTGGQTAATSYYLVPLPTYYRVTSKTLSTGGDSYTWNYSYAGAATNNPSNSSQQSTNHPYNKAYTEFRGHSQVTETDPYGAQTITNFNQDDCTSGRTSQVLVKNASGTKLQKSTSSYDCTETDSTVVLIDNDPYGGFYGQPFTGIRYRWVRTASETKNTYQNSPNTIVALLTTDYVYETTYGNLTQSTESGTGVETRVTQTDYYPNPDAGKWLVGLPARVRVLDGGGTVLSSTLNLYDGANTFNTAPTDGILTATRTLISGTQYAQTSMGYDDWGNVTSQTTWTGYGTATDAPTEGEQTTYTCYGSQESIGGKWCPNNDYHTYALWTKNALGHVTDMTYDYSKGLPLSETDPNGAVTSATYDVFGRFTSLTKPNTGSDISPSLNVSYQNSPFVVTLTQPIDATHTFTVVRNYDGMGRQTSSVTNGVTTLYQYGYENGPLTPRVDKVSMPGSTSDFTTTKYDALGRPDLVTAPDGTQTDYIYDGLETKVKDANNHETTTVTDVRGQTVSVTPPTGPAVTFQYYPSGNLWTATRGGATMTLTYDKAGRKLTMDDPDMGFWQYSYDALGNMKTQTDARTPACVTNLSYDALNRLTGKSYSNCPTTSSVTYNYDSMANGNYGKGRRTSMTNASGSTSWLYDVRGRMVKETKVISSNSFDTEWTYNSADLPVTMEYPDGEIVTTQYNNDMQPVNVAGANAYASMTYDSAGRLLTRALGNGQTQNYHYYDWDEKVDNIGQGGRLETLTTGSLQNLAYVYDKVGNVMQITNSIASETNTYAYDNLDRLTSWQLNQDSPETYAYDNTGNLDQKGDLDLQYLDSNHAHAATNVNNTTYSYDANGNQTARQVGGNNYTFVYDAENHLVSVSGPSLTAQFEYDGDGARVKSIVNGETIRFVGGHYELKDSEVTKYYFAGASRVAVRKYVVPQTTTLNYLLGDHLGSTSLVTDASGALLAETRYKPWGEVRFTTADTTLPTRYTFTGQYSYVSDDATDLGAAGFGLMYFSARWFDPSQGRFTQPDTIVPTSTQGTQAWDRYAFVNNNPVRYNDPTGHDAVSVTFTKGEGTANLKRELSDLQFGTAVLGWTATGLMGLGFGLLTLGTALTPGGQGAAMLLGVAGTGIVTGMGYGTIEADNDYDSMLMEIDIQLTDFGQDEIVMNYDPETGTIQICGADGGNCSEPIQIPDKIAQYRFEKYLEEECGVDPADLEVDEETTSEEEE